MAVAVRCSQSHPNRRTARMYLIVLSILFTAVPVLSYVDPDRGPFCENAVRGLDPMCCVGRHDNCSLPRGRGPMETVCYCDSFCVRTHPKPYEPDCCPDYRSACLGEPTTPKPTTPLPLKWECYINSTGSFYGIGEYFMDNCNSCTCVNMTNWMEPMCTKRKCLVDQTTIDVINRERRGWTAGNVTNFWGKELEDGYNGMLGTNYSSNKRELEGRGMRPNFWWKELEDGYNGMLGTNYSSNKVRKMYAIKSAARIADLPVYYDWRSNHKYLTQIVDQKFCNASWSFSLVSMFSDRVTKSTRGRDSGSLSYQQHRNCVKGQRRLHPCNSGHLTRSQRYLRDIGLVKSSCYPPSMETRCAINERGLAKKTEINCPSGGVGKLYRATVMSRISGESTIMKEIIQEGPVVATMRVFDDFFVYRNGVYNCGSNQPKHGRLHSVKIVGWGEDYLDLYGRRTPVKYWVAANSWGTDWGEGGFFKIRRGTNECDIEEFVITFYTNTKRLKRSVRPKNPFLVKSLMKM